MNNYIFPFLWMRGESEEVLREEIEKIYECGIRAFCVEARPHDDFCGPGWWHDMDIVIDEAKKRNMKVWILDDKHFPTGYAAGLIEKKYPERKKWYLADTTADIFGGKHTYTLNVSRMLKPVIGYWQIGQPANYEEREKNQLLAIIAVKFASEDTFTEETIDLTDKYQNGSVQFTLPDGQWRIHILYKTRTDGGNEDYINMIDYISAGTQIEGVYEAHYQHYKEEFGKTIAGFFSDEPELGNTKEVSYDAKLGKKGMPLPWSEELEEMLKKRCGTDYKAFLPFLFEETDRMELCPQMRFDYMDCVTRLYEKDFSCQIGNWCKEHGVAYIGHVVEDNGTHSRTGHGPGHWFRAMSGQDMAGIDVIGSQVIFGAPIQVRKGMGGLEIDGEFYHYILGKLGASSGHLDPKKKGRTMCELFGAYGWNFGVRDMKYLLDHLLCKGVNHLVPHAFSMADYPDIDCPPHFYARGNNGQFPWFSELMKYANRMCEQLNGGTHVASVAVLYDGEADWVGDHMPMEKIGRALIENQIEFDVVSIDMLKNLSAYQGKVDGKKLEINGVVFESLLIPYTPYIPYELTEFIEENQEFPVCFVGGYPDYVLKGAERRLPVNDNWKKVSKTVALDKLIPLMERKGMKKIILEPSFSQISVYHYRKKRDLFMVMNESPSETFTGRIVLPVSESLVSYDGMKDRYLDVPSEAQDGGCTVMLELKPGQSCLLLEKKETVSQGVWEDFHTQIALCTDRLDLTEGWEAELIRPKDYPVTFKKYQLEKLVPISDLEPKFSGIIRYTKEFKLNKVPERAYFFAENVYETIKISVNGEEVGMCLTPPYQMEMTHMKEGNNTLVIEVANTPGRDQLNYPMPPFDFLHEPLEPSGMYGKVEIYYRNM